ncbi:3760_t:CDS:2 [Cetraspora pellucida]|uniref:3760_t:CDS:1 n=1 Tax=Cetraspora pellucida TaxID=1433469 RepID=A0ACA9QDK9_9GLOM|nr:3760_t:CDS:2 [Cetraspora pellucida]
MEKIKVIITSENGLNDKLEEWSYRAKKFAMIRKVSGEINEPTALIHQLAALFPFLEPFLAE